MSSTPPAAPEATSTWTPPEPYKPDEAKLDAMWAAAGRGDWMSVTLMIGDLELGWLGEEMKRLAELGEHYGTLEKGADSLMTVLNAHTKDGTLELSEGMRGFLDTALEVMAKKGQPASDRIKGLIEKLKNGEEISQGEAQELYAWCADAKLAVIPPQFSSEALAAQAKSARERYDGYVNAGKTRIGIWSVG